MKLITAIVNKEDSKNVCNQLLKNKFYVTRLATTGGFLMAGHDAHDLGAAVQPFKRINVGAADGTGADQQYFVHRCCLLFVDKRKKGRAVRVAAAGKARPK